MKLPAVPSEHSAFSFEALQTVLESAYEGIVVCDTAGIIWEFNQAYSRFLGKKREDVIGKLVTDEIENTRLHIVAKTGIAERGYIQRIQGQDMVVHRIPIYREQEVIGAVGMLIFAGVTELYEILGRMQEMTRKANEKDPREEPSLKRQGRPHHFTGSFEEILGDSPTIVRIKSTAKRAARTSSTILLTGESGTGKELFAKAIHASSPFAEGPFVSLNCAAIPEHLLEAELFGYEEGAFTGARKGGKPGKFELAHKGTLLLDEIGDMPMFMQVKILRVLQEREVERVGGISPHRIDVRIIAATHQPLEDLVAQRLFREDLYHRLNIIRIDLPPLRSRQGDIPILLEHHLQYFSKLFGIRVKRFAQEALEDLIHYTWPGNVRELVNTVEMLMNLVEGSVIEACDLPARFREETRMWESEEKLLKESNAEFPHTLSGFKEAAEARDRQILLRVLSETGGNKAQAAMRLGIHRSTLYIKLKRLGIEE